MLKLNFPSWYMQVDEKTKQDAWKLSTEQALESAVSSEDFEELKSDFLKRINELLKLMAKSDSDLDKRLKVLESEIKEVKTKVNSKKKSQLSDL